MQQRESHGATPVGNSPSGGNRKKKGPNKSGRSSFTLCLIFIGTLAFGVLTVFGASVIHEKYTLSTTESTGVRGEVVRGGESTQREESGDRSIQLTERNKLRGKTPKDITPVTPITPVAPIIPVVPVPVVPILPIVPIVSEDKRMNQVLTDEEKSTDLMTKPYNVTFVIRLSEFEKGEIVFEINPKWAPLGAERFRELVNRKYFHGNAFFRVIKGFMAQFGMHGDPNLNDHWAQTFQGINDDPVMHTNARGTISFACSGPNTRSTQLFINTAKSGNAYLDKEGFSPIGMVVHGWETLDRIYDGYGEGGSGDGKDGKGPAQGKIKNMGNKYLRDVFPRLSVIENARYS